MLGKNDPLLEGTIVADTNLFNVNDGVAGRDGGPYLDIIQAQEAEIRRAKVEDREPNLDGLEPYAGIVLVPASVLVQTEGVNVPSRGSNTALGDALSDSEFGAQPVATLPSDVSEPAEDAPEHTDEEINPEEQEKTEPLSDDEIFGGSVAAETEQKPAEPTTVPGPAPVATPAVSSVGTV